jgi:hypothetical protein
MHPRRATLLAFCDGEAGADRSRRIAKHLSKCKKCHGQLRRIHGEKEELSAGSAAPPMDGRQDLAGVLSAMAAWREDRAGEAASELRNRLQWQIETYFGFPAVSVVERPGIRAEELLGKASEILDVFLGPNAAQAVTEDVFRGLDWAVPAGESCR